MVVKSLSRVIDDVLEVVVVVLELESLRCGGTYDIVFLLCLRGKFSGEERK